MKHLLLATAAVLVLATPATAQDRGYAARDDAAQMTTNGFLDRKDGVSEADFYAYWLNAHGPLAARIDGMHQYWQHHLGPIDSALLPAAIAESGISVDLPLADQLEGLAEVTFASEADRAGMGASPAAGQLMADEQNIFQGTYLHSSVDGHTRTLLDRAADGTPQGVREAFHVILLIGANEAGDRATFRRRVVEAFAGPLTEAEGVVKVRYSLFEPYDAAGWDTPNVDNERTEEQAYDAWVELAFTDRASAERALAEIGDTLADSSLVSAVHAYPVREAYTLVYDGRPTPEGLRGVAIQRLIDAVGAANQNDPAVLHSLFDDATQASAH